MADFKTSFIPKKSTLAVQERKPKRGMSLITFLAFVVFLVSLVIWGGLYLYKNLLERNVEEMTHSIDRVREAIDPKLVANLSEVDKRLTTSKQLFAKHTIVSPVLQKLEDLTLEKVRYEFFQFDISNDGEALIVLGGEAADYSSLALQSDIFGDDPAILDPIFENLNLNARGNVSFDFSGALDMNLILYEKNFEPVVAPVINTTESSSDEESLDALTEDLGTLDDLTDLEQDFSF